MKRNLKIENHEGIYLDQVITEGASLRDVLAETWKMKRNQQYKEQRQTVQSFQKLF